MPTGWPPVELLSPYPESMALAPLAPAQGCLRHHWDLKFKIKYKENINVVLKSMAILDKLYLRLSKIIHGVGLENNHH